MIKIRKPLWFMEIGRKDNQEDYLYPSRADVANRVFILCDGMGGHDNGEVASRIAAENLGSILDSFREIDMSVFESALAKTYDALDTFVRISTKKPGTTMVSLCINNDNYLVAHIGDSRIYHIRPSLFNPSTRRGGLLYQSSDHSLVNELLRAGEITEEEAHNFPQKNIITRAMQPHLPNRYRADVFMFDDIQADDYFFLCSDGVLEQLSNDSLCAILADNTLDDIGKLSAIKSICDSKTHDNYSCWLIPIDKVDIRRNNELQSQVLKAVTGVESIRIIPKDGESTIKESEHVLRNQTVYGSECLSQKSFIRSLLLNRWIRFFLIILLGIIAVFGLYKGSMGLLDKSRVKEPTVMSTKNLSPNPEKKQNPDFHPPMRYLQ